MRIAVLYDYLRTIGGGERVALTLAKRFDADLITTDLDPTLPERAGFPDVRVRSLGDLLRGPPQKQLHATWKFRTARFHGYDFYIFVGNFAHFAAPRNRPNLYYCLTPTRAFHDQRRAILQRLGGIQREVARVWSAAHGWMDRRAACRCDRIVAISEVIRSRVKRYYSREAPVIYPPVATSRLRFREIGDAWLSVGRIYPEKRIELQLEIFRRLPREKLVLVGGHSPGDRTERYHARLRPPPNVEMLGEVPAGRLEDLYARCRGFLTTAVDEDFGITPVEAMAAGKCVLAADEGGYRETVLHGKTGFLLPPEPEAFVTKIRELDDRTLHSMKDACVARAREFDESVFLEKIEAEIEPRAPSDGH